MHKKMSQIVEKRERLIIGLMSGTSADGVDAALMRISGCGVETRWELLHCISVPLPDEIRKRALKLMGADAEEICRMNFIIGRLFAEAALMLAVTGGVDIGEVDVIGSHGQTAYHIDAADERATLQIGEAAVIAEMTGCVVVSDFRPRDIAAGGRGAPLVPFADYVMFRHPDRVRAMQNIGGIANVTVVTPFMEDVIAFDTGPGNGLIDEAVRITTDGEEDYDVNGRLALAGEVNEALLEEALALPFFAKKPPKTTGKETFGRAFVRRIMKKWSRRRTP